jgi:hypothetical protein
LWSDLPAEEALMDLLDKHSEDYGPERFLELADNQRKREKETRVRCECGCGGTIVSRYPPLRMTLEYDGCEYCLTARAALEDAWDAHKRAQKSG